MIIWAALRGALCEGCTYCLDLLSLLDLRDETAACCKAGLCARPSACGEVTGFRDEASACGNPDPFVDVSASGQVRSGEWDLEVREFGGEELTACSAGPSSLSAC